MTREALLTELLKRSELDQNTREAVHQGGGQAAFERVMQIDDDNGAWLEQVLLEVGWPGRSLVGEEGSHAAWLLAQHSDRRPAFQRHCLALLEQAVALGEASPTDLAFLTDRVLLASKQQQIYGTQISARDGQLIACRLADPASVNERRARMGLGTLEDQLRDSLDRHGPPQPILMACPCCRNSLTIWPPELGGETTVQCPSCRKQVMLRPVIG